MNDLEDDKMNGNSTEHQHTRKRKRLFIALAIVGSVLLLASLAYNALSYRQVRELNEAVTKANADIAALERTNEALKTENSEEPISDDEEVEDAGQQATYDGDFVALRPSGGYGTYERTQAFEFTPHKDATKYVLEIKMMGQASYPESYPEDQTLVFSNDEEQSSVLQITKNMVAGDYNWRITALTSSNGSEVVLQSTEDRNYQVF